MVTAKPSHSNYADLLSQIENGLIKIPQFQRDFVWSKAKSAALLDSIIKGYPVGTFIFWHTTEKLRTVRSIGNKKFMERTGHDYSDYVLDGQQRLTSIYAAVKGVCVERDNGKVDDFSQIFVNLDAGEHEDVVTVDQPGEEATCIPLTELLGGQLKLAQKYDSKYWPTLERYADAFTTYSFPVVSVSDAEIDVATDIFTRINVGGKPLTPFEIIAAKTYDERRKFDLAVKFEELVQRLSEVNFDAINEMTPLQLISLLSKRDCRRQTILKLDKADVIDRWDDVTNAIEHSVDYFRAVHGVVASQLLPYGGLMIPFAYFFYQNDYRKPNADQSKMLTDFFWRCSIGGRYSSSFESRVATDLSRIDSILAGEHPMYDWPTHIDPEFLIKNGRFAPARAFVKAILCIYASYQPRSFDNNGIVHVANDTLKRANSRNYHHFFPRAYLKKIGIADSAANNILNITIIDAHLNKNQIRAKSPNRYMAEFEKSNPNIEQTIKSHLLPKSIWADMRNDDYQHFLKGRAERVSRELGKRVIPQPIDMEFQELDTDETEDDSFELD